MMAETLSKEFYYQRLGGFLGRNGQAKSAGLVVCHAGNTVQLQPVTSRGKIGVCMIEMPSEPNVLSELAQLFASMAEIARGASK